MSLDQVNGGSEGPDGRPPAITVWGSYNGGSVGDTLILLGILSSIGRVYGPSCRVRVLSMGLRESDLQRELTELQDPGLPNVTSVMVQRQTLLPRALIALAGLAGSGKSGLSRSLASLCYRGAIDNRQIRAAVSDSDLLLIGGGNLFMDMFPSWPYSMSIVTEEAEDTGCPVVFFGVGAGPIRTDSGEQLLTAALNRARAAVFRDGPSRELARERLDPAYELGEGPDAALGVVKPHPSANGQRLRFVGVNIAGVFGEGWPYTDEQLRDKYVTSYARLVEAICAKYKTTRVLFLTTNSSDRSAERGLEQELSSAHAGNYEFFRTDGRSPGKLLEMASQCHLVLATRLHSALAALIAGAKVIAVSYQPKVTDVLRGSGLDATVLPISELTDGISPAQARLIADSPPPANRSSRIDELREAVDIALARATALHP